MHLLQKRETKPCSRTSRRNGFLIIVSTINGIICSKGHYQSLHVSTLHSRFDRFFDLCQVTFQPSTLFSHKCKKSIKIGRIGFNLVSHCSDQEPSFFNIRHFVSRANKVKLVRRLEGILSSEMRMQQLSSGRRCFDENCMKCLCRQQGIRLYGSCP